MRIPKHTDTDGGGLLIWVLIVVGSLVILFAGFNIALYLNRPRLKVTAQQVDCTPAAVSAFNRGTTFASCVIPVSITNLKGSSTHVDWTNTDGPGGFGNNGSRPVLRIYATTGKFCDAIPSYVSDLQAHQTIHVTLTCYDVSSRPKNYDPYADSRPAYLVIHTYAFNQRINFNVTH